MPVIMEGGRGVHRDQQQIITSHLVSKAEFGELLSSLHHSFSQSAAAGPQNPVHPWRGKSSMQIVHMEVKIKQLRLSNPVASGAQF